MSAAVSTLSSSTPSAPGWLHRALRHRSFFIGAVLSALLILAALLSFVWTPWSPYEMDLANKLASPSGTHWLGTDAFGRDVASLLLVGARNSILVGVIAVGIGLTIGTALGLLAAAKRGWVEELIMRLADFTFAFPAILSAIMMTAVFGAGIVNSIIAIGIFNIPTFARVTRASANAVWSREYILASRACGKGSWRITLEHVLPNILSVLIVQATIQFAIAILAEAALSYLGLGTQPPQPSWGRMLSEAQTLMFQAPLLAVWPGVAIALAVLGLNLLGDGLRDLLDPVSRASVNPAKKPHNPTMSLLEVSNLRIRLQTHRGPADAVRGVSFSLARGETLGLIGESGCGKSITAMSLMGLLPDSAQVSGSIRFDGQELVGRTDAQMCKMRGNRIGMVFQEPMTALNPVHTIGRQVAEPLRLHRGMNAAAARAEAIALLDRVGIPNAAQRFDAYPHQFSGGQRQRITIAMALACGPDLLIADEPTTALDVTIQQQILDLISDLVAERNMALILISHDLGVISQNVDRMMVMYGGSVVESGSTASVFSAMAHPYTRGLFAARPHLGAVHAPGQRPRLSTIPGTVPELVDLPAGCPFAGRCSYTVDDCHHKQPEATLVATDADGEHLVRCLRREAIAEAQSASVVNTIEVAA